jgi:hypothetical protein
MSLNPLHPNLVIPLRVRRIETEKKTLTETSALIVVVLLAPVVPPVVPD